MSEPRERPSAVDLQGFDFSAKYREILDNGQLMRFMDEFQEEPDRAAAVLGAAYLSDALERVLRRYLLGTCKSKDSLLEADKPLGSFGARIKLTDALGLLATDAYHDLEIVRRVRNDFAHKGLGFSFDSQDVKARCGALRLIIPFGGLDPSSLSARVRFNHSVLLLALLHLPLAEMAEPATRRISRGIAKP